MCAVGRRGRTAHSVGRLRLRFLFSNRWRGLKRKPTDWLFPGNRWHTASHPVSTKVLLDVDTQAGVGQNKPLSGGVSYFPSSSACERVGRDRPIHT
jgi:hypothetical protein